MSTADEIEITAAERGAQAAVRSLAAPAEAPSEAFRARLREGFVAGTLVAVVPEEPAALPIPEAPPAEPKGRVIAGPWRLRPSVWVPLAAAAALVFALGLANRGPRWEVVATTGEGVVRIDGQSVPARATEVIGRLAARGGRVQLPDGVGLDLVAPGQMAVRLSAGSDVRLSGAPNRWIGRSARIAIEVGDVFISTGREFRGAQLAVTTPEARVDVLGTSFAVMRFGHGTCVCVMEGRVRVGAAYDGSAAEVAEGERRFCYPSAPPYSETILESSVHELHDLQHATEDRLGR